MTGLTLNIQQIILLVLIFLFILKKLFARNPFVLKYDLYMSIVLLLGLVVLVAVEFWNKKLWIGVLAVVLGLIAILKILIDSNKRD
ncbi:MAG TPA: hypothetical protein P5050_09480 [Bacteroidia bacterium]|nr:hypothetical protein [Sphingobacteriales bacterium]HPD65946.1 hypothetical protein [Bacteroidia bacterium]HRS59439.1 hypothetical protein [Bacteroidia bacterium]HRU68620.1 hypothetical protein [Bacteroidia bacterium]